MKYEVIAEFVDLATGERHSPAPDGEKPVTFEPHDEEQAARLVAARCLRAPEGRASKTSSENTSTSSSPLSAVRKLYKELFGSAPSPRWNEAQINAKVAEKRAADALAAGAGEDAPSSSIGEDGGEPLDLTSIGEDGEDAAQA